MTAPHMANEPIRRHRTGPSARPARVRAKTWIAAKLEIRQSVDQQSSRRVRPLVPKLRLRNALLRSSSFADGLTCVTSSMAISPLLRGSASPREPFPGAARLEIRDFVDQQSTPLAPQKLRCAAPSFVSLAPFVDAPVSALLRGSAPPRESFLGAAKLESRNFVDQQSSRRVCPLVPKLQLRNALFRSSSFVGGLTCVTSSIDVNSLLRSFPAPPEPKNTFADALTRYPKTSYGEKTDFCNTPRPRGGESRFRNSLSRKHLQLCKNAQNPRRLRKTTLRRT
jgi:hypothetical protein